MYESDRSKQPEGNLGSGFTSRAEAAEPLPPWSSEAEPARALLEQIRLQVGAHPWSSLAVAAAAGFVLGGGLRRRWVKRFFRASTAVAVTVVARRWLNKTIGSLVGELRAESGPGPSPSDATDGVPF